MWYILERSRYLSIVAVLCSLLGSALLFVVGADKTVRAFLYYTHVKAVDIKLAHLSPSDIAITYVIRALDTFLIALALLIFAYGVYCLFIRKRDDVKKQIPGLPNITSVGFLKHTLGEVVIVIILVTTLEEVLVSLETLTWHLLVLPVTVLLLSLSMKFLGMRDH
ncbi:MAG: YqhA family protein [Deltaproteobacteria bacterium]|nr:YqhA family protein [Deltaproteobacteria bacterium]